MTRAFVIDPLRPWPLRLQIGAQIASAIRQGVISDGTRLPSSRLLARMLGVSQNTVVEAYERLIKDGPIAPRPGSGVRVTYIASGSIPNLSNLRRTVRAAHYPARILELVDLDGTPLYLNVLR